MQVAKIETEKMLIQMVETENPEKSRVYTTKSLRDNLIFLVMKVDVVYLLTSTQTTAMHWVMLLEYCSILERLV